MQFAEAKTSMSAQSPSIFNFNNQPIQIVVKQYEPWFVASDVAKVLGYRDAANAVRLLDQDEADTHNLSIRSENGVEQERKVLIVNESGLYALVLKSRKPEAKPFRRWVTSEVLPAIRKNGQYSAAEKSSEVVPLTPRQQYKIQRAVAERAKGSHVHFNTIYKAIKIYFKVAKYDQIPASRFDECINFIQTVDLRIPEVMSDQPVEFPKPQLPSCPHCELVARGNIQQASVKEIQQFTIDARNALAEMEKERIRAWTCLHEIVFKLKVFA